MAVNIFRKIFGKKERTKQILKSDVEAKTKHYTEKLTEEKKPHQDTLHKQPAPQTPAEEDIDAEIDNLPPSLLTKVKDPKVKSKLKKLTKMMAADGVNLKKSSQVKQWIKQHPDQVKGIGQTIETYRRQEPKVGRNDPCSCGSGKKYKKCCGKK
ncbi:MAG TPA: SEC-C metal-binding domain-containing protein [Elusimicrobiales bacterium]|nr:SEC-C metal-binding domain-containing protein [Elusimicrobiales bacterium]